MGAVGRGRKGRRTTSAIQTAGGVCQHGQAHVERDDAALSLSAAGLAHVAYNGSGWDQGAYLMIKQIGIPPNRSEQNAGRKAGQGAVGGEGRG